jgi:hypothetical protein
MVSVVARAIEDQPVCSQSTDHDVVAVACLPDERIIAIAQRRNVIPAAAGHDIVAATPRRSDRLPSRVCLANRSRTRLLIPGLA